MKEEFSEELKKAIKDGAVSIDEGHKKATIFSDVTSAQLNSSAENGSAPLLHKYKWTLGLRAELEQRHNYEVEVTTA